MERNIIEVKGDATLPIRSGNPNELRVIIHICNDINKWGKGFVISLSNRYYMAKEVYHQSIPLNQILGSISSVLVSDSEDKNDINGGKILIVNMIAQHGIAARYGIPPIRYDALEQCLNNLMLLLYEKYREYTISVHMPRIGCGLAGGKWLEVEVILRKTVLVHYDCYVYDLK